MLHKLLGDGTLNTIQALLTLPIYRLDLTHHSTHHSVTW